MALEWEILFYDTDGNDQTPPVQFLGPWTFSVSDLGGFDTFTLTLKAELDDDVIPTPLPEVGWEIDIHFNDVLAYRGRVETIRPAIQSGPPAFQISGAGLMARIQEFEVNTAFIDDEPLDVGEVYLWLADRFLDGPVPAERLGSYQRNIDTSIGYNINHLEMFNSHVRREFDRLAEVSQGKLIWGFDAPGTPTVRGLDRLYVKEKNGAIGFAFTLGEDPLKEPLEMAEDLADVINSVRVIGGTAIVPNLLYNSSFELPRFATSLEVSNFNTPIVQDGWRIEYKGLDVLAPNWVHDGLTSPNEPYHGTYCFRVYLDGASTAQSGGKYQHYLALHPSDDHWISIPKNSKLKIRYALRSSDTLTYRIDLQAKKGDDKVTVFKGDEGSLSGPGYSVVEEELPTVGTTGDDEVAVRPILYLLSDGTHDVDAADMFLVKAAHSRVEYIPGEIYERVFRADDSTTLPELTPDALDSISTYGLRHQTVQTEEVTSTNNAKDWATGFLNENAIPRKMGSVTLEPCPVHVRFVNDAGGALGKVLIEGARVPIPSIQPTRLTYKSTNEGQVSLTMELGSRRPNATVEAGGATGGPSRATGSASSLEGSFKANSRNSFSGGSGGPSDQIRLTYGPDEDGVYQKLWDATDAGGLADGSEHAVTFMYDDGTEFDPASGTLVTVRNERGVLLENVDYTLVGNVVTLLPGAYPVDRGDGSERITVDVTPAYSDSLL